MQVMAVFCGRFHPFHKGHAESFNQLAAKFGIKNSLLAISGKQEQPKSPFSVSERATMAVALGVPQENIMGVKQPYKATEYIDLIKSKGFDPEEFALVFAVSKKDMEGVPEMNIPPDPRFEFKPKRDGSPSYLQPYNGNENNLKNVLQHAYVFSTDVAEFPIAGQQMRDASSIRNAYINGNDRLRNQILSDLYDDKAKEIKPIFDRELLQPEKIVAEYYKRIKPLLAETSLPKKLQIMKKFMETSKRIMSNKSNIINNQNNDYLDESLTPQDEHKNKHELAKEIGHKVKYKHHIIGTTTGELSNDNKMIIKANSRAYDILGIKIPKNYVVSIDIDKVIIIEKGK